MILRFTACSPPFKKIHDACIAVFPDAHGTWEQSRELCKVMDGDLAVIDDAELFYEIIHYIKQE